MSAHIIIGGCDYLGGRRPPFLGGSGGMPPSLFEQPHGNSLGAGLDFTMIPLKMVKRFSISCDPLRYRNRVDICFILKFSRQVCVIFYQIYLN